MKWKIISDMMLNIGATTIPTLMLQLLFLPAMARKMSEDAYGMMLTMVALLTVVPATMGNVLNNMRLLKQKEYQSHPGDFNLLVLILESIVIVTVIVFACYFKETDGLSLNLTVLLAIIWFARDYYAVSFRLHIDYRAIAISSFVQVIGYALGYGLFNWTGKWQLVYLAGQGISFLYILRKSNLWTEPWRRTPQFKRIAGETGILMAAKLMNRAMLYADRLLVFPLLGGSAVSVYYTATLFGKVVSMGISPINSVVLTYLAKTNRRTDRTFAMAMGVGGAVCFVGYIGCIMISRPVLTWLYPQFVQEAMKYIYVTSAMMVCQTMISIADPFILKFFHVKWQVFLNGGMLVLYIGLSISLLVLYGLMGFCVGALFAYVVKLGLMIWIYLSYGKNDTA